MKVIDRLPLSLLCDGGALLRVQPLNKLEAQELARQHGIELVRPRPYAADKIAAALGVPPDPEERAEEGEPVLVCDVVDWRTIHFYLVERIGNADGVTVDGECLLFSGEEFRVEGGHSNDDGLAVDPFAEADE